MDTRKISNSWDLLTAMSKYLVSVNEDNSKVTGLINYANDHPHLLDHTHCTILLSCELTPEAICHNLDAYKKIHQLCMQPQYFNGLSLTYKVRVNYLEILLKEHGK